VKGSPPEATRSDRVANWLLLVCFGAPGTRRVALFFLPVFVAAVRNLGHFRP